MTGGQRDIMADVSVLKSWQGGILDNDHCGRAVTWRIRYRSSCQLVGTDGRTDIIETCFQAIGGVQKYGSALLRFRKNARGFSLYTLLATDRQTYIQTSSSLVDTPNRRGLMEDFVIQADCKLVKCLHRTLLALLSFAAYEWNWIHELVCLTLPRSRTTVQCSYIGANPCLFNARL